MRLHGLLGLTQARQLKLSHVDSRFESRAGFNDVTPQMDRRLGGDDWLVVIYGVCVSECTDVSSMSVRRTDAHVTLQSIKHGIKMVANDDRSRRGTEGGCPEGEGFLGDFVRDC